MGCKRREIWDVVGGRSHDEGEFLISITVFNKFQTDRSSGSVKCMPSAIMLQRKQNCPLGVAVNIILFHFSSFPSTFKNIKVTVLQFLLKKSIYGPTIIQRDHQNTERSGKEEAKERWRTKRESKNTTHSQNKSDRNLHK